MMSTTPILADLPDTSTTGSYTVSWGAVPQGLDYTVEEDGTEVYSGSDLSLSVSGKAEGIYSYRVKADVVYGDSPWSDVVSVVVAIPPEEGTIDVDVPWPADEDERQTGDVATFTLPGGATLEMVWVEPGTFMMGSSQEEINRLNSQYNTTWYSNEGPQHQVTITRGFWLGKYELTQGQWTSVMGTRPWADSAYVQEDPSHPGVYISWEDVQSFIVKLNQAEVLQAYRLPTEAEWEYACRAGTTTRWSFGDDESQLQNYAWYSDNAGDVDERYAHEVGTWLPNPWGLYDMHGNVYEWCWDWYGSYSSGAQVDPMGPSSGSDRVFRSGCFNCLARSSRSAFHTGMPPRTRDDIVGARLVRQEPQPEGREPGSQ
jgi:formylglycine-generating enzyme required for sulfatase activity